MWGFLFNIRTVREARHLIVAFCIFCAIVRSKLSKIGIMIKCGKEVGKVKTIHDVAKDLGVSTSTVSRAISGKGRIGKETRERVLQYIDEYGYYPNASAQSLAQAKTNNIAIILPEVDTLVDMPFFHSCMYAVGEMAQANEYDILVIIASGRDTRPLERLIMNRKVDGMILTRTYENDCFVSFLKEKQMPFVTIGQVKDEGVVQVDSDNAGACMELTTILLAKGISRIAYLGGNVDHMVNKCRYEGYLEAYEQFGKKPEGSLIYMNLSNRVAIERAVGELLKRKADCLLCQDDFICEEVLHLLAAKKIKIPEEIRVASCHYSRILENNPVTITSLRFDIMQLGNTACKILLDMIDGKEVPVRTLLDYEVILKESTK